MIPSILGGRSIGPLDPALDLNFTESEIATAAIVVCSGGASGTRFNSTGTLQASPAPRFDFGTAKANNIPNSALSGAVVGPLASGGALPTGWTVNAAGLTVTVVALGTDTASGLPTMDVRFQGTATGTFGSITFLTGGLGGAVTVGNAPVAGSIYAALIAGSTAPLGNMSLSIRQYTAAGATISDITPAAFRPQITGVLQRFGSALTTAAGTAFLNQFFIMNWASSSVIDLTVRLACPQLENAAVVNTPMLNTGTVQTFADPQGVLIEVQQTNFVRNTNGTGAVAGTPGTNPTNWSIPSTVDGLTKQIVGAGSEAGISYVDVRYSGTLTAGAVGTFIPFETTNGVAALNGQTWTQSLYLRLMAGSFAGIATFVSNIRTYDGVGTLLENLQGASLLGVSGAALATQRFVFTQTLANSSDAFVQPCLRLVTGTAGAAVDFTLRIGMPVIVQAAYATTPEYSSSGITTRTNDNLSITGANFSALGLGSTGTMYFEGDVSSLGSNRMLLSLNDGTNTNEVTMYVSNTGSIVSLIGVGGVVQASTFLGSVTAGSRFKAAMSWGPGFVQVALNGVLSTSAAPAAFPAALTQLCIGRRGDSTFFLTGHAARVKSWNRTISGQTLRALTI